ncbi:MAG: hypothetical protein KME47_09555 [Nodosilinea sp. WJT8-NPBG4]|jgi:predicted transcriptional regulator|nr:hypothetical protein [Nodosilinea sp. WJT8-NPBG4]
MTDKPTPKRMSINLTGDAAEYLEDLAESQGITQTEALRRAIATESYIQKSIKEGYRVLLQNKDEIREIVFR